MKKSFTLLELILVILLLSFLTTLFIPKKIDNSLDELKDRIILQMKHLRYKSLINNKYDKEDSLWFKKRWTFKFFRCSKNVGGFYYVMYSDENKKGKPNLEESIKDPLSNKYIYSSNKCEETNNTSKYVLITKKFHIQDINISCNSTSSIGQISFGNDGKVYSKLSSEDNNHNDYEIEEKCTITMKNSKNDEVKIYIENKTGYIR